MKHILIASSDNQGKTLFAATDNAGALAAYLETEGIRLDAKRAEPTEHASTILRAMVKRLDVTMESALAESAWLHCSFDSATNLLDEYCLATGHRKACGPVAVGSSVHVEGFGPGTVRGFIGSRVTVDISRFKHAALQVMAPAKRVHILHND